MKDSKAFTIERILSNSVYGEESGFIGELRKALAKMSETSLRDLEMLIDVKRIDAADAREAGQSLLN